MLIVNEIELNNLMMLNNIVMNKLELNDDMKNDSINPHLIYLLLLILF